MTMLHYFLSLLFASLILIYISAGSEVSQSLKRRIQKKILLAVKDKLLSDRIKFGIPFPTTNLSDEEQENSGSYSDRRLSTSDYTFVPCDDKTGHPCDTVIARFSAAELKRHLDAVLSKVMDDQCLKLFPTCGADRADGCKCVHDSMCLFNSYCLLEVCPGMCYDISLEPLISSAVQHGVEIRKICSSCNEESSLGNTPIDSNDLGYCTGYGRDATVSGLLVIPTDAATGEKILPGPLTANIFSRTLGQVTCSGPSSLKFIDELNDKFGDEIISEIVAIAMASIGRVVVVPDNMGFEESYDFFKGFGLKKQYQTSGMPLFLKTKRIIAEETSCISEVSNNVIVAGYSEGGMGAISMAEALESYGANIIKLFAGGAPLKWSSTILHGYRSIVEGTFPVGYAGFFLPFIGQTFSTTIGGPENYQMGQDLLAESWMTSNGTTFSKHDVVNTITANTNDKWALHKLFPTYTGDISFDAVAYTDRSWMDMWNSDFIEFLLGATQDGDLEPCNNGTRIANATAMGKPVNKLCEALSSNDMAEYLRKVRYPFEICHSQDDEVAPIEDTIEFSNVLSTNVFGNHMIAGGLCFGIYLEALLDEFPMESGTVSEETGEDDYSGTGSYCN